MNAELFDYKNTAHDLIEDIVESGMSRRKLYKKLSFFLKCSENDAHLGSMTTIKQVKRTIYVLKLMRYRRIKSGKLVRNKEKELFISGHKGSSTLLRGSQTVLLCK